MSSCPLLATEKIWIEKSKYDDAEKNYFERLSKLLKVSKVEIPEEPNKESKNMAKSKPKVGSSVKSPPTESCFETEPNAIKGNKTQKQKKGKIDRELATSGNNKVVAQEAPVIKYEEISGNKQTELVVSNPEEPKVKKNKKKKKNNSVKDDRSSQENSVTRSSNTFETDIQESKENIEPVDDEAKKKRKDRHRDNKNNKISGSGQCTLVSEIAKARQHIKNSLEKMNDIAALAATPGGDVIERLNALEKDNASLRELVETLKNCFTSSENRIKTLEARIQNLSISSKQTGTEKPCASVTASKKVSESKNDDDDDDVDLFGSESEEEDEAAAKVREQRLAEYAAKKSKKPALIAKSSLVLDVKPWDDETDLNVMEKEIRKIVTDGLLWGASKFLPVAFGIKKLSISCVVEDDKVSIDWLTEEIEKQEEYVQSVDVAAFNKI